jgi:hypothetical protein
MKYLTLIVFASGWKRLTSQWPIILWWRIEIEFVGRCFAKLEIEEPQGVQNGNPRTSRLSLDLTLVLCSAWFVAALFWTLYDFLPADVNEVQAVVALAAPNAEAKAALAESLSKTPNPDRVDLRRMRRDVNEILVTETARTVTGDLSLQTPSALAAARARDYAERMAAIESRPWRQMSYAEQFAYVSSPQCLSGILFVLLVVGGAAFGWSQIFGRSSRY